MAMRDATAAAAGGPFPEISRRRAEWERTNQAKAVARSEPGLRALLSLRPWQFEISLLVAYIVITRIGALSAAKIGIQLGPAPLFLTDLTLLALLAIAFIRRPGRLLFWVSSGTQAGAAGFAVWVLCLLSIIYFLKAFPTYHVFALRDLAIFGYSLFFPVAYFAISSRTLAVRVTRYFVYSGFVVALLVLLRASTGVEIPFLATQARFVGGEWIDYIGSDDFGAILACSMMAFAVYAVLEQRLRRFHLVGLIICLLALTANGTRSAFLGAVLAAIATFLLTSRRYRGVFVGAMAVLAIALIAGASLPTDLPGVRSLNNFYVGLASGLGGDSDQNASFRIVRWKSAIATWEQNPVLGVGYGRDILDQTLIGDLWDQSQINRGMPHNTFLFVLARMGLVGLGLVLFAWGAGILTLGRAVRRWHRADELAVLNILIVTAGFAAFVLFFERPMNNSVFWIMLAVGFRLSISNDGERYPRPSSPTNRRAIRWMPQ